MNQWERQIQLRSRPEGQTAILLQRWEDLFFLHWKVDPEIVAQTLPHELQPDTFDGKAYLGIVIVSVRDMRPPLLPPIPFLSEYCQINVRTYVLDQNGFPGVWFYSMDCDKYLAVKAAQLFFHLPFYRSEISIDVSDSERSITCSRHGTPVEDRSHFAYRPEGPEFHAGPGSAEFFFLERYLLFSRSGHQVYSERVFHEPLAIKRAMLLGDDDHLLRLAGFHLDGPGPDHWMYSPGVEAEIFAPQRCCAEQDVAQYLGLREPIAS